MATQGSVETVQGLMEGEAAEADFMDRRKVYRRFNTVDGRNPANQSIWRTSHFSLGFYTFQVVTAGFLPGRFFLKIHLKEAGHKYSSSRFML